MSTKRLLLAPFLAILFVWNGIFNVSLISGEKIDFVKNKEIRLIKELFFCIKNDSLKNNPLVEKKDGFIIVHEIDPALRLKGIDGNGISGYAVSLEGAWISFQNLELQKGDYCTILERANYLIVWSFELQKEEKIFAQNLKNIFSLCSQKISFLDDTGNATKLVQINTDTIMYGKKIIKQRARPRAFIDLIPYKKEIEEANEILEQIYKRVETMGGGKTINLTGGVKP